MNVWIIIGLVFAALLALCFLLAIANFTDERFAEKYNEFNNIEANTNLSPLDFVEQVLRRYIKKPLEIVQISNIAGDAYGKGKLFLSGNTLNMHTLASYTIIAHELGHALQDVSGNKLKKLHRLRRVGRFIAKTRILMPSLVAGMILLTFGGTPFIIGCGLLALSAFIFILALVVKLMTISIEKDASKNAMIYLAEVFEGEQLRLCKKFLNEARLTYWAEFLRIVLGWTGASKKGTLFN